jgi:hypothetical protein
MARTDWNITGTGGIAIIDETGSKRCQLTGTKLMLWNGRSDLINVEIICESKYSTSNTNAGGAVVLRSDATANNCYRLVIYGATTRTYYIQKVVAGVVTNLGSYTSTIGYSIYGKTRFRVDGYQLSVDEWESGAWVNRITIDDTSQACTTGYVGLMGYSTAGYYVVYDNVEVREKS